MGKTYKNIYQFKIALKHIKPPIWRRIQVPEDYSFWDLHVAIQNAMGWSDDHLHSFYVINPETGSEEDIGSPGVPQSGKNPLIPSHKKKLVKYFTPENNKARYEYDFGDSWMHDIVLEAVFPKENDMKYPICTGGKRKCPPEDCGGLYGYMDLLDIIADPENEEYDKAVDRLGENFDPEQFDPDKVRFEDPEKHLGFPFVIGEDLDEEDFDDDFDEDGLDDEEDTEFSFTTFDKAAKALSRRHIHSLWERSKKDDLEGLSVEEQRIVKILKDHEEEFFNDFEFSDLASDREYDPKTDVNPFLHISIHSAVENQLADKNPIEVFQFYNAMRNKRCSHHDTLHLIGAILAPLMFQVMKERKPFDIDGYRSILKKYKTRNPDKMFDKLLGGEESGSDE